MAITFENFFRGLAESGPAWAELIVQQAKYDEDKRRFEIGQEMEQKKFALQEKLTEKQMEQSQSAIDMNVAQKTALEQEMKQSEESFPLRKETFRVQLETLKLENKIKEIANKLQNINLDFFKKSGITNEIAEIKESLSRVANLNLSSASIQQQMEFLRVKNSAETLVLVGGVSTLDPKLGTQLKNLFDSQKPEDMNRAMGLVGEFVNEHPEVGNEFIDSFRRVEMNHDDVKINAWKMYSVLTSEYPLFSEEKGFFGLGAPKGITPDMWLKTTEDQKDYLLKKHLSTSGLGAQLEALTATTKTGINYLDAYINSYKTGKFMPSSAGFPKTGSKGSPSIEGVPRRFSSGTGGEF